MTDRPPRPGAGHRGHWPWALNYLSTWCATRPPWPSSAWWAVGARAASG